MRLKDGFVLREVAGKQMVLPVGKRTQEVHGMIALNDTGSFLWKLLQTEHSKEELVEAMFEEYEVARELAESDIEKFVQLLTEKGLLEKNND